MPEHPSFVSIPAGGNAGAGASFPVPVREEERLALLEELKLMDTLPEEAFDDLTLLAAQICGTKTALISLLDEDRQWFKSRLGLESAETPRRMAFCNHTIMEPDRILVVPDAMQDARFAQNDLVTGEPHIRFYAGAPLTMEGGLAVGSLCVIDDEPRSLTELQMDALAALARQVVSQIRLRRQNNALREAREARDQFFNLPLDLLCVAGLDGYFKTLNRGFPETLGYTMEELLATPFLEFVHPEDVAVTLLSMKELKKGTPISDFENRYRCQDGTYIWLSWKCVPTADRAIYASARNISLRKNAEARLIESERRFREAIEFSAIGMALVDLNGHWLQVNQALCNILGRTQEELLGCTFQEITHPDDLHADLANLHDLLAGRINHYQMEKRYFHQDGHLIWIILSVTLVRDADGQPVHFVSQILDISERHSSENLLQASLEEKEILLKEVHHRVKNNLQVISSLLQLQSQGLTEPKLLSLFREAQDRVRAMTLIHEGLYRKVGQISAVNFDTHVRELVNALLRTYSTGAPVRLEAETEPAELTLELAVPLSLIVNELVTNALKYGFLAGENRPGGGTLRLQFRCLPDDQLFLSIGDEGPGLPTDFNWRSSSSLGLKIVNMLVGQIGGSIEILPAPNAAITITFPRHRLF